MNHKNILKGIFLTLGIVTLQACDSDFTETGSNIIGEGNFNIVSYTVNDIKAYNQPYSAADASRLNETSLGSLKNGLFGESNNNLVVQLVDNGGTFSLIKDDFVVDSVYVYVPYFSQFDRVENDENKYNLRNVYGNESFDLEVYQNGYFLNNANVSEGGASKYLSNTLKDFNDVKIGDKPLNNAVDPSQNKRFFFNNKETIIYRKDSNGVIVNDENTGRPVVKERLTPGMWLDLDKEYFQEFIKKNKGALSNAVTFNDVFRGLLFKAKSNGTTGMSGLVDLSRGKLVVILSEDKKTTNAEGVEETKKERREISLTFAPNNTTSTKFNVSLFDNANDGEYQDNIKKSTPETGDEFLYLRGGEGSVAVIDFLRSNDFAELKAMKNQDVLVNEAYLTIYVDKNQMNGLPNPERLFLYDFDNSVALSDYANDNITNAQYLKAGYSGIFVKEDKDKNKEGYYYKFKITDHIRSLIKNKSDASPKLALMVANNFATAGYSMQSLETPIDNTPRQIQSIPSLSLSCPIGTVLHGTKTTDSDKKMKLEIFYTKVKK